MSCFEKSILKYIFLLLLVFFVGRFIFIAYNFADLESISFVDILLSFVNGLRMDLSALSYISPLVVLLLFFYCQFHKSIYLKVLKGILAIVYYVYFLIVISELPIYQEWQTKLNSKAISYLSNMNEVWRTATWLQVFAVVVIVPALTFLAVYFTHILFKTSLKKTPLVRNIGILVLALGMGFLGARGGFYQIPLSVSAVFYSNNRTLNFATVNSFWSLGYGYYKESRYDEAEKYKFYSDTELNKILDDFYHRSDVSPSILNNKTPNIIFVLFESWSADLVDTLDRTYSVMPNWRRIRKESLSFTRCYATGRHSEEGILAVFSGFPSLASSYLMGFTH